MDSPSYEAENPSLPDRYREEFDRILSAQYLERRCKPESLQAVREALVGFDGTTFTVSEACGDAGDWELIRTQVESWRYRIALSEQRVLRLIPGGKKEAG